MNPSKDQAGFKAIGATGTWHFRASKPPGNRPAGAYFTPLPASTPRLAVRLGIPKRKLEFVFYFLNVHDLIPLRGDRGRWIFYSRVDYDVEKERQVYCGESGAS